MTYWEAKENIRTYMDIHFVIRKVEREGGRRELGFMNI